MEQTECLKRHGRQSMAAGSTRVFVVTPIANKTVVAYYAWTMPMPMSKLEIGHGREHPLKADARAVFEQAVAEIRTFERGLQAAFSNR